MGQIAMKPGMKKFLPAFALNCAMLCLAPLRAAELPPRREVLDWLSHERFADLEQLTSELRQEKLAFYAGHSKLSRVYGCLDGPGRKADDSVWKEHIIKLEKWAAAYPQSPAP